MDKAFAFAALVVGLILIYVGYSESQALGAKVSEAFSGSPSDRVLLFYVGGAAAAAFGGFQLFRSLK
jgi:hypothetical protein